MSFLGSPELKVGTMVVAVMGLIGMMSFKVAQGPGFFSGAKKYNFTVENAGGLVKNSAVKMAGIKVGTIDDIQLDNGKAKVIVSLQRGVPVTASTRVELRTDGILGDKHVELIPGNPNDPELPNDSPLAGHVESNGLDDMMKQVGKVAKNLTELTDNLNKATHGKGDDSTPIGRIIINIEKVSRDLATITGENRDKITEIVDRVKNLTANLDKYINADSLGHLKDTLKNVDEISDKINKGQGTIGKLVNDDQTIEELNTAIGSVNNMLGGLSRWETGVDFHSEYTSSGGLPMTKSYLALRLQPGLDRYYELDVIDDPRGYIETTNTSTSIDGGPTTSVTTVNTFHNKLKFSALFAKNFYDFTLKGGLMESSGGVGMDYFFLDHSLRFSFEAFNFASIDMRLYARYNFFKGLYITGGAERLLNTNNVFQTFPFVGAGLFITNDDLKVLATRMSF